MIDKEKIKSSILEACSESEYGSWEFWSDGKNKTEDESKLIVEAIIELVKEKKIFPTDGKFVNDRSYKEVVLDENRLKKEIEISINTEKVDPHTFYWFLATKQD